MAAPFHTPSGNDERLLYILTSIWWCQFFDFGYSERCVVVPCFNLPFPNIILSISAYTYVQSVYVL